MNFSSPKLIINKLVLVGHKKNYTVPFHKGLNIIYGDSDTGKSSILNLIDYCLGSSRVAMYDELEYNGQYCLLELELNEKIYTIKRDIFMPSEYIEVYHSEIENISMMFPRLYGPNYKKEGPDGFFSDFLLQTLNIPLVKIKQSPSKADSLVARLSFRDILKFCYLDQDEVGSKYILNVQTSIFTKNKETFKFIHNILDSQITELEEEITKKVIQQKELEKKYEIISSFMRETQIKPLQILEKEIELLDEQIIYTKQELQGIDKEMKADTQYLNEIRDIISKLEERIKKLDNKKEYLSINLEQNIKLKKEYKKDILKLKTSIKVNKRLTNNLIHQTNCPVCQNTMTLEYLTKTFDLNDEEILKSEVNALNRRHKGLINLIDTQINELSLIEQEKKQLLYELNQARDLLDTQSKEIISPYLSQRDGLISHEISIKEEKGKLDYLLKVRNQLELIKNNISLLDKQISELNIKLAVLKQNAPSTTEVVNTLGDYLKDFMDFIKIRNASNISVSKRTFLPVVRNKDYVKLTSGGLRTLTSVGYFISLMQNTLSNNTNLPSFLMIDTIGKYLGKTKEIYEKHTDKIQDKKEGMDDPDKYLNIYKYLINLCNNDNESNQFQIIVVDNEVPFEIEKIVSKYVVKRFSIKGKEGYDIGFIDDASI